VPEAPLAGIRVLDLTRYLAGPFASRLLADYGADVVKVESPKGREFRAPGAERGSYFFLSSNRNKRSLSLDVKTEAGRLCFERLLPAFDVVVENFRPGVMEKLGLAAESLLARPPRLVDSGISGFGADGPYCDRALPRSRSAPPRGAQRRDPRRAGAVGGRDPSSAKAGNRRSAVPLLRPRRDPANSQHTRADPARRYERIGVARWHELAATSAAGAADSGGS